MDLELELFGDVKEKTSSNAIGKVYIVSLSSQPVDHEESTDDRQKVRKINLILRHLENKIFKHQILKYTATNT